MNHIPTVQENLLAEALKERNIELVQQYDDGSKTVDIYIPSAKIDIEVDGKHHYMEADQIMRDFKREYWSERAGYHTIHIPNDFIENKDLFVKVVKALVEVVERIRTEILVSRIAKNIKQTTQ